MNEAGIGRLLVASLHQGIADLLPTRLDFYESWLNPVGLREGRIGLAPLAAVLSFLRQEGDIYHLVMTRAGEYTADWVVADIAPMRRTILRSLPPVIRLPLALRLGRELTRQTYRSSRPVARLRGGQGTVEIRGSIFCEVRDHTAEPMCDFYAAAYRRLLALFSLDAAVEVAQCRATGAPYCALVLQVSPAADLSTSAR